jgi:uncharacterized protein (TIGR00255 family)
MIFSMTGYGRGEAKGEGIAAVVEMRSVNGRYLEVSTRTPQRFMSRENELKELVRKKLSRGKVNVTVTIDRDSVGAKALDLNDKAAADIKESLNRVRKTAKIKETVTLSHILAFKDELIAPETDGTREEAEWSVIRTAADKAVNALHTMRKNEGGELARDLKKRISAMSSMIGEAEKLSQAQVPHERERLRERVAMLFENEEIDEQRLELEIVLLADKLDVAEECVRWKSHVKFFNEILKDKEPAGRRLNFLLQEMHREVNTIGSKSNEPKIGHLVVQAKEELERIREQVQNIE